MIFEISNIELKVSPYRLQPILNILKEKGAPIDGCFWLKIRDGFKVTRIDDPCCQTIRFIFEKEVL